MTSVSGVTAYKTGGIGNYYEIVVFGSFLNYISAIVTYYVNTALNCLGACAVESDYMSRIV